MKCPNCGCNSNEIRCPHCGTLLAASSYVDPKPFLHQLRRCSKSLMVVSMAVISFLFITFMFGGLRDKPVPAAQQFSYRTSTSGIQAEPDNQPRIRVKETVPLAKMPMYPDSDFITTDKRQDIFGNRYSSTARLTCWAADGRHPEQIGTATIITDGKYESFQAIMFARPGMIESATVWAEIHGDGRLLWSSEYTTRTRPVTINISVSGINDLTFSARTDKVTNSGTNPGWMIADAVFVKAGD